MKPTTQLVILLIALAYSPAFAKTPDWESESATFVHDLDQRAQADKLIA